MTRPDRSRSAGSPLSPVGMSVGRGTLLGFLAILSWSCYGALIILARGTPPYLALAVFISVAAATLLIRRAILRRGFRELVTVPLSTLILGVVGLLGSNAFFVLAIAAGTDAVAVSIISFAWPILMVGLVVACGITRISGWDALALALGFAGMAVTALQGGTMALHWGMVLAFCGALCWAVYSGLRKRVPAGPQDLMASVLVVSAFLAWGLHVVSGEPLVLTRDSLVALVLVGILPVGLANLMWDLGVRHGDTVLLAGLAFIEPVASAGIIVLILGEPGTIWHVVGLSLILAAIGSSLIGERARRRTGPGNGAIEGATGPGG